MYGMETTRRGYISHEPDAIFVRSVNEVEVKPKPKVYPNAASSSGMMLSLHESGKFKSEEENKLSLDILPSLFAKNVSAQKLSTGV
ncbi:hypothetical protein Tco_0063246 [Tanacetum coccineum]